MGAGRAGVEPEVRGAVVCGGTKVPGATVQYVNGVRYEGTNQMPLGFRGQLADPMKMPTDTIAAVLAGMKNPMSHQSNTGQGGYTITILEDALHERGSGGINQSNDTQLLVDAGHKN